VAIEAYCREILASIYPTLCPLHFSHILSHICLINIITFVIFGIIMTARGVSAAETNPKECNPWDPCPRSWQSTKNSCRVVCRTWKSLKTQDLLLMIQLDRLHSREGTRGTLRESRLSPGSQTFHYRRLSSRCHIASGVECKHSSTACDAGRKYPR
jgi:hypothetical protein